MGKFLAALIVICAVVGGAGLYYTQVYAFYDPVEPTGQDVVLTSATEGPMVIPYTDFEAIDATSSPIRYRACFRTDVPLETLEEEFVAYDNAEPLEAPYWFGCYSADGIGEALETGRAKAFMSVENVTYGVDRIVAIFPEGNGYAWHQINRCGEVVFGGQPAPEGCPPMPAQQ
ncbi:DUF6446 family protein [Pseudooceanicola sp. MF1-13]|uniref:DUF6446 family protein n=1 Tax=Pseudooceanicola sp. MF1-13 TaxID=3379095 RepID=UPI0038913767